MKKNDNFFYHLSFHNKLLFIFLPLVFMFIIITGGACLHISEEQLKVNSQMLMENGVHQTETLIEDKLQRIKMEAVSIVSSSAYNYQVFSHRQEASITKEYLDNRNKLYQQMTDMAVDNWDLIDSLTFVEKSGNKMVYMRSPSPYVMKDTYDTLLKAIPDREENKKGDIIQYVWQNRHEDTLLATRIPRQVSTLYCISGNEDSRAGAILAVNIRTEPIQEILENIVEGEGGFAAVLSGDSASVYEESKGAWNLKEEDISRLLAENEKGSYITKDREGNRIMLSYERLETNDWVIVNGVPLKSIMTGTELMKRMIFVLVIMMLLIASVPLLILSHWMSRDIVGLACQIEEYQIGNKEANFHTRDQKELKQVAGALNQFVKTIQDQITGMMESETRKRKAELRLLQSQINPHFLYNTLISVKTLIDMQRYQQASDMFQSLIDFYVIGLNHGQELISVRKELETIRNYLSILEVRYNNSFEWMINVDEDVLDCEILTLTLQPLVENAIQHGVNNKTEKGMIDISGCSYEDTVILTVWDNGQGIREETLDELREELIRKELPENRKDTHFGLWNSNQRLKLYFGEEYGIEIDSEYGKYTSVTVRIRNRKYGE